MKIEKQDDTRLNIPEGCIAFHTGSAPGQDAEEVLRFEPGGDIYIRGKLVENDKDVVEGIRAFLRDSGYMFK